MVFQAELRLIEIFVSEKGQISYQNCQISMISNKKDK